MKIRKFIFFIVLVVLGLMIVLALNPRVDKQVGIALGSLAMLLMGILILLRKRIIGEEKAGSSNTPAIISNQSISVNSSLTTSSSGQVFTGPKVRREKNFIVEDNLAAIRWPQECSWCGGVVEYFHTIKLNDKSKNKEQVQAEVKGIPYCKKCARAARWTDRINTAVFIMAAVIGIALTIFVKMQESTGAASSNTPWYLAFLVCFGIGYGISWLLLKLPLKLALRKRLAEPVTAWFLEDNKSDGLKGVSVAIAIPRKTYADKFAQMNVTAATSTLPVSEVDDESVVRIIPPTAEKQVTGVVPQVSGKVEGIDLLLECTRDDILDTSRLWERAKVDLQAHGQDGSHALAGLIEEMLKCRTDKIGTAISMSRHVVPTTELTIALKRVISASPLTPSFFGARFRPQIEGGGMIGWTDGTAAHFKAAASEAVSILENHFTDDLKSKTN